MAYMSGTRLGMQKIKRHRTADCVVGGFRYAAKKSVLGSLLLGLHDDAGLLQHVGFTSSFTVEQRRTLLPAWRSLVSRLSKAEDSPASHPGGISRWATERTGQWKSVAPNLVVEVSWDHFTGGRFRHGTKFLRFRPEKAPRQCALGQVELGR